MRSTIRARRAAVGLKTWSTIVALRDPAGTSRPVLADLRLTLEVDGQDDFIECLPPATDAGIRYDETLERRQ